MITPEIKDRFLSELVNHGMSGAFVIRAFATELKVSEDEIEAIMKQCEGLNLVSFVRSTRVGNTAYYLSADGIDFNTHGGFVAKEKLLQKTFEKLNLELESLKQSAPQRAEAITGIVANIVSILKIVCAPFAN